MSSNPSIFTRVQQGVFIFGVAYRLRNTSDVLVDSLLEYNETSSQQNKILHFARIFFSTSLIDILSFNNRLRGPVNLIGDALIVMDNFVATPNPINRTNSRTYREINLVRQQAQAPFFNHNDPSTQSKADSLEKIVQAAFQNGLTSNNLLDINEIPIIFYNDGVFRKYKCAISKLPMRTPVFVKIKGRPSCYICDHTVLKRSIQEATQNNEPIRGLNCKVEEIPSKIRVDHSTLRTINDRLNEIAFELLIMEKRLRIGNESSTSSMTSSDKARPQNLLEVIASTIDKKVIKFITLQATSYEQLEDKLELIEQDLDSSKQKEYLLTERITYSTSYLFSCFNYFVLEAGVKSYGLIRSYTNLCDSEYAALKREFPDLI